MDNSTAKIIVLSCTFILIICILASSLIFLGYSNKGIITENALLSRENTVLKRQNTYLENKVTNYGDLIVKFFYEKRDLEKKIECYNDEIDKLKVELNCSLSDEAFNQLVDDIYCLTCIIYQETASIDDMMRVGQVAINRANINYPRITNSDGIILPQCTIRDVALQSGQYAAISKNKVVKLPSRAVNSGETSILQDALNCAIRLLVNGEKATNDKGEEMPANVCFQAQFKQGSGVWYYSARSRHYYCYL